METRAFTPAELDARLLALPAQLTITEAAELVLVHPNTIRRAIRLGELEAFMPRGRNPRRAGRGQGYRIARENLQRWYFSVQVQAGDEQ